MENFNFKKSLGQNFLIDQNIIQKIIEVSHINKDSFVIEVGPGSGNLTKELAKKAKQVLCYEIDSQLEEILDQELLDYPNVKIIFDDFLKRDVKNDIPNIYLDNLYFVSNLPYYITTPIIEKIIASNLSFKQITVMVQKEVGERFNAKPKTKAYNSLTVFLNYYFDIKQEFLVSRNAFFPKPNVDSSIISLRKKENLLYLKNKEKFEEILKNAFQFKRKTIKNNLKNYDLIKIQSILEKHGFSLNTRAEELPLETFVEISNCLEN